MIMSIRRRHFLVREVGDDYQLRELDSTIAHAIHQFGTTIGLCTSVQSCHWTFYFMNSNIAPKEADRVAAKLAQEFQDGKRS